MADVHNAIKYYTQLLGGMAVALGISRDASGIERLSETLGANVDPFTPPDWQLLLGIDLWADANGITAVVGEGGMMAVVNPIARNNLVVVDQVTLAGVPAGGVGLGLATEAQITATLTFLHLLHRKDTRPSKGVAPATAYSLCGCELWAGSDPTIPFNSYLEVIGGAVANATFVTVPYVLRPGTALWVQGGAANQAFTAAMSGRVRPALPGELVFGS